MKKLKYSVVLTEDGYATLSSHRIMEQVLIVEKKHYFRCTEVTVDSPFLRMKVLGADDIPFDVWIPSEFVEYVVSVVPEQDPVGFSDSSKRLKK